MNDKDTPGRPWGPSEQPAQWGPQPPPAPRRPRSAKGVLTHTAAAVLGLIIGAIIGSSTADDSGSKDTAPSATATATTTATETASAPTPTPTPTPSPTKEEAPAGEIPGDGTYVVGEDIKPGTYRTDGPDDSVVSNCYWARLSGTSGEFDEIIANSNTAGPATVTISASDAAFQTTGCKTWKKTG
ncbi:hypothetical protein QF037_009623 [Streptomyces canus]|uniref:hypothetical protein n=1 Tax=Streptomyces canus TaxID=58343 RepID=UPI0027851264|nr:hypothetical protein [Streptomyces canus]MDQ0605278.1 hypothetical protein [Streptomyces canus]